MKWIDLPPVWLFGAIGIAALESRYWGGPGDTTYPVLNALSTALFWCGIALIVGTVAQMIVIGTTPIPHQEADKLVTTGMFRISRNPIYLGDLCVLTGCCLRWDAWVSLLLVPLLGIVISRRFIVVEEQRLSAKFGAAFDAYRARVRRWI